MNLYEAHNQWASRPHDERFETLDALAAAVKDRRGRSRAVDIDSDKVEVVCNDEALLTINGKITPSEPTHWSFGQFCALAGVPADYARSLVDAGQTDNPERQNLMATMGRSLVVGNLNFGIRNRKPEASKFMTVERDTGPSVLQAVTGTKYGRIWDADVVDAVQRIVERSGGRFYNPKAYVGGATRPSGLYASDRDVFMFMIDGGSFLEVGERAKLNRGFFVSNSEVGKKSLWLKTFMHNGVCGNHIVWDVSDVSEWCIRHTSGAPARFDGEVMPKLMEYCNTSAKPMEATVRRAQEMILGKDDNEVREWINTHGKFSKKEVESALVVAKAEEGDCRTLWQVVAGLSAYARGFEWVDSRTDLETRAGKLLEAAAA